MNSKHATSRSGMALLSTQWSRLDARERRLISMAVTVVVLALVWWLALAPAISTLRLAGEQRQALEVQAQQMQLLQAEAEKLKSLPKLGQTEALKALETAVQRRLGNDAKMSVVGGRATVTLKDIPADALAGYLADARANARATPVEARLTRAPGSAPGTSARWNGTLSLSLPQP